MYAEPKTTLDSTIPATAPSSLDGELAGLFKDSVGSIEKGYLRLGHTLGWRFLTGPQATLSPRTDVGFITLNPGGDWEPPDHPRASCEGGNAYLTESWPGYGPGAAPLQRQVRALFTDLHRHLDINDPVETFITDQVLTAYFVPFRSPRFATLPQKSESVTFGRQLWTTILARWTPRVLLTIDTEAFAALRTILRRDPESRQLDYRRFDTGWGQYQAEAVRISVPGVTSPITLGRLPHLSTFKLFSRDECRPYLETFLAYIAERT